VRDAEVRYAERDGDYLAFSVFGDGSTDLAIPSSRFPIDLIWDLPQLAAFMEALGRLARVIVWDARGCGASDPILQPVAAQAEVFADDTRAILQAADSQRATLFDMAGSSIAATVYAATYPDSVQSLILVDLRASYPELGGLSLAQSKRLAMRLRSPERLRFENPRAAHDPIVQRWWGRAMRLAHTPHEMARMLQRSQELSDLSGVLSALRIPTLVLHRRDNRVWDIESSRTAASLIPNARFVELPGAEHDLFLGDTAPALAEIERFMAEPELESAHDRVLATVLFTDIVASTEQLAARGDNAWRQLLDDHDKQAERLVYEHRGRIVRSTGDGTLATFDGPARAVRCAAALIAAAAQQGITLRAGLHTAEIELRPPDIAGIGVHTASRIADLAGPNEILVSRTVLDLTAGSDLQFEPRGEHQLKGVPGTWPIFAAHSAD
jgi:class 3 adenylate cyclase